MIGLFLAIIIVNIAAFKMRSRLTTNLIIHIWIFTSALEMAFDIYVDLKYHGYWYFSKHETDWAGLLPHILLVPAVNVIYLNFYPLKKSLGKQIRYLIYWTVGILLYENVTLLPEPWGYFHYGWWTVWHSVVLDPVLLVILLFYYKWILRVERKLISNQ
jgi:hypothetical protein